MNKTHIEWVKNPDGSQGYTWNPITGCLNGCEYCYARKLANGRLRSRYLANPNVSAPYTGGNYTAKALDNPFYPRFWMDRLVALDTSLKLARKPLGIFPCDMSDWCGIGIPEGWSNWVLEMAERYSQHRFYLLTKQPQNLTKFSPFPDNCWVGVSATNCDMFADACYELKHIKAKMKYLSLEPMLNFNKLLGTLDQIFWAYQWLLDSGINQVIIGSQTKPYKPPKIEWVQEIVQACDKAGIPVFLKDNLRSLILDAIAKKQIPRLAYLDGSDLRQELPTRKGQTNDEKTSLA